MWGKVLAFILSGEATALVKTVAGVVREGARIIDAVWAEDEAKKIAHKVERAASAIWEAAEAAGGTGEEKRARALKLLPKALKALGIEQTDEVSESVDRMLDLLSMERKRR